MPRKPSDRDKLREDANETAYRVLQEALGERPKTTPPGERTGNQKNPEAVKRGQKGGVKGGKARKRALTKAKRQRIARRAARIRWRGSSKSE